MPVHPKKRKASPLLFLLLALLILLLPMAFLIGGMPPSVEPAVTAPSSEPTAVSQEEETSVVIPSDSEDAPAVWQDGDFAPVAAIIEAAKEEAAEYVAPEESSDSESEETSSSALSKFPRPELYGQQISVYFKDLTSGVEYWYAPDEHYFVASLIKAPYCMFLYQKADRGEISLDQTIEITADDLMEGTGSLQSLLPEELPKEYTIQELLTLSIRESDNTAMRALLREFPAEEYRDFAIALGVYYPEDILFVTNGRLTAQDAGVYLNALNDYFAAGSTGAALLREDMLHTKNAMIRSDAPVVRKYGWASLSFHDMAVVEGEHPYLLAILTDRDIGRAKDYTLFRELSECFEQLLAQKYSE